MRLLQKSCTVSDVMTTFLNVLKKLKLELKRHGLIQLKTVRHPRLAPQMLAATLGFSSRASRGSGGIPHPASRRFRFPSMLCDFGWHCASAHSGSLWQYDLSQRGRYRKSAAYSGFHWQHVGHGMCSSLGVLKCVPRLTDCNSVWRAAFPSPCKPFQTSTLAFSAQGVVWRAALLSRSINFIVMSFFHKPLTHIGADQNKFSSLVEVVELKTPVWNETCIRMDFMQSQRKDSDFHVLPPHTVPAWGNWEWVSHGFHTGMASLSASHLLLGVASWSEDRIAWLRSKSFYRLF